MTEADSHPGPIRPMGLLSLLLYFGIPAAVLYAFVYLLIPALDDAGLSPFMAYLIALLIPLILMFAAALIAYRIRPSSPRHSIPASACPWKPSGLRWTAAWKATGRW